MTTDLLNKPLTATLAQEKRPVIVQQISRVVRIAFEGIYKQLKPNTPFKLGWNNFQFLNELDFFKKFVNSLKSDIWDKARMHKFVEDYKQVNGNGSDLLDMLSIIMIINHIASPKS